MRGLFVDTAGWMACADEADPAHSKAVIARDQWLEKSGLLVTTDYVVDETLTLLRLRLGLDAAEAWWSQVEASSRLRWEFIGPERADAARHLFFRYRDKDFSFTDCTSFAVMREFKLCEALTTDRHFNQMGFTLNRPTNPQSLRHSLLRVHDGGGEKRVVQNCDCLGADAFGLRLAPGSHEDLNQGPDLGHETVHPELLETGRHLGRQWMGIQGFRGTIATNGIAHL